MNEEVEQAIAPNVISVKIVVKGKTDHRYRTLGRWTINYGPCNVFQGDLCRTNMRVFYDVIDVIENKGPLERV